MVIRPRQSQLVSDGGIDGTGGRTWAGYGGVDLVGAAELEVDQLREHGNKEEMSRLNFAKYNLQRSQVC